jgi:hypothetical protein
MTTPSEQEQGMRFITFSHALRAIVGGPEFSASALSQGIPLSEVSYPIDPDSIRCTET